MHPPSYIYLKWFGCLYFATTPKEGRGKFHPRSIPSIFLGYPFGKKGYKLLNLSTHSIFYSSDAVFHKYMFPYHPVHSQSLISSDTSFSYVGTLFISSSHTLVSPNATVSTSSSIPPLPKRSTRSLTYQLILINMFILMFLFHPRYFLMLYMHKSLNFIIRKYLILLGRMPY